MSRNIGEVRVSVLPDADRFRPEAIAALKKAAAGLSAGVELNVDRGLRTKMDAAIKKAAAGLHAGVDLNVNRGLRTKMENAVKTASAGLSANVDLEADAAKLEAEIAALRAKGINIPVDFDVAQAGPAFARLRTKMIQSGLADFLDITEPIGKIQSQIIILKRLLSAEKLSDFLNVNVDANTLKQELDKVTSVTQTIPVELDAGTLQKDLTQLGANAADIAVGVDTTDAQAALTALGADAAKALAKASAEADKAAAAQSRAWSTYGKNLLAAEAQERVLATAAAKIQQDAIDAQNKAWVTYGKNLIAAEAQEQALSAAAAKVQQDAIAAQNKAWLTYGKNVLAAEAQGQAFAAATAKAQQDAIDAQNKAWITYGKNLLAAEAQEQAFAAAVAAQADAFSSYQVNIDFSAQKALRDAMSLHDKIAMALAAIPAAIHLNDTDATGQALSLRAKIKAVLSDIMATVKVAYLGGGAGGSGGGGGGGGAGGAAAGAAAGGAAGGFGLLGAAAGTALGHVSLLHAGLDLLLEGLIAVTTAAAAAAVGLAAMAPAAKDVYTQMKAISTVNSALGDQIPTLAGQFGDLTSKMAPQVIEAFGGALSIVKNNSGGLSKVASEVANMFDTWIAKIAIWSNSQKNLGGILQTGVGFLSQFGTAIGHLLSAINNLMKSDPGTAHFLVDLIEGAAKLLDWFSKLPKPIVETALALHSLYLYGNIASGLLSKFPGILGPLTPLVRKVGGAFAGLGIGMQIALVALALASIQTAKAWNTSSSAVATSIGNMEAALNAMSASQAFVSLPKMIGQLNTELSTDNTTKILKGWTGLNDIWQRGADKIKVLGSDLKGIVTGSLPSEIKSFTSFFGDLFTSNAGQKEAAIQLKQDIANINAEINKMLGSSRNLYGEVGALSKQGFSFSQSLALMDLAGVKWNDTSTIMAQKVNDLINGYKAMSVQGSLLNNSVNAITFAAGLQNTKVSDLNSAWDTFIATITGGQSGFLTVATDITGMYQQAASSGDRLTISNGRVQNSLSQTGAAASNAKGSFTGLNAQSLALQQTFQSSVTDANSYLDNLTTLAAAANLGEQGTNMLERATKDLIGQMLPAAKNSTVLTTELYALAQRGGYTGADSFKALSNWVGKTQNPMQDLQGITTTFTKAAGNLTTDVKNLSTALGTTLNQAMSQAIFLASGGQKNFDNFAKAVLTSGGSVAKMQPAADTLIKQLQAMTHNTSDTKAEFISFAEAGLGLSKQKADALWKSYEAGQGPSGAIGGKAGELRAAFEKLAGAGGKSGLGLTKAQADLLWSDFGTKAPTVLNALTTKHVPQAKAAFEAWAGPGGKSGLGLTKAQADLLWGDIHNKGAAAMTVAQRSADIARASFDHFGNSAGTSAQKVGTGIPKGMKPGLDWLNGPFTTQVSGLFTRAIPSWYDSSNNYLSHHFVPDWKAHLGDAWRFISGTLAPDLANFFTGDIPHWYNSSNNYLSQHFVPGLENGLKGAWNFINGFIGGNMDNFFTSTLPHWWDTSVSKFNSQYINPVKDALKGSWNWISGTFGPDIARFFTQTVPHIFDLAVSGISRAWNKVYGAIKGPLHTIATPMRLLFEGIDDVTSFALGTKPLAGAVNFLNKLAGGGQVTGGTPGKDSVLAALMPGEVVVPTHMVRAGAVDHLRGKLPGFAGGGMVEVPGFASGGGISLAGYFNPMRNARATPERIDQGVDFAGSGPVGAIGAATIVETGGGGWPGGPYMAYRLNAGSLAGQYIYLAENIQPTVRVGQNVVGGQTIANMFNGGTGIEMGFAAPGGGSPMSQLAAAGGISGANLPGDSVTAVGQAFDNLLVALGAPRAPNYGQPAAGKIPGGVGNAGNQPNSNPLAAIAHFIGGAIAGIVETLAQVFSPLGHIVLAGAKGAFDLAKVGVDLAGGNVGAAVSDMIGLFHPGSGGAKGEYANLLTALPKTLVTDVMKHIASGVAGFASSQQAASAGTAGIPGGVVAGSGFANLMEVARYLMMHGASRAAAAGIAGTIAGETVPPGSPESVGSGGFGLIGWTGNTIGLPAGYHGPTGNVSRDLAIQTAGVLGYINANGGLGPINAAGGTNNYVAAGQEFSARYERPAVRFSDTRPATAAQIYAALGGSVSGAQTAIRAVSQVTAHATTPGHAMGGLIMPGGMPAAGMPVHVFDRGGVLSPGINAVYNLTGKPEHVKPVNSGSDNMCVTLEFASGGSSDFDQLMLTLLRKYVRVKGGGDVQRAFGRH